MESVTAKRRVYGNVSATSFKAFIFDVCAVNNTPPFFLKGKGLFRRASEGVCYLSCHTIFGTGIRYWYSVLVYSVLVYSVQYHSISYGGLTGVLFLAAGEPLKIEKPFGS